MKLQETVGDFACFPRSHNRFLMMVLVILAFVMSVCASCSLKLIVCHQCAETATFGSF